MTVIKPVNVLGLLSTSSLEGVYVALLNTDGVDVFDYGRLQHIPYDEALREKIRPLLGTCPYTPEAVAEFQAVNRELTVFHAEIVKDYIAANGVEVDVIGYEGINLTNYASGRRNRSSRRRKTLGRIDRHPGCLQFSWQRISGPAGRARR